MKIKIWATLLLIAPLIANAEDIEPFPSTTRGIQIVPLAKINIPQEVKQKILTIQSEEDSKGYLESNDQDQYIRHLLLLKRNAPAEINTFKNNHNPYDTHLKSHLSDIKLAFSFNPLRAVNPKNIIGYAALGSYRKDQTGSQEGWTGIGVFFNEASLGTCSYSIASIQAVQLSKETTEYLVNNKPSNNIVEGNYNTGFMYSLNWYTNDTMSTLECANMNFNNEIIKNMIALANNIDKDLS